MPRDPRNPSDDDAPASGGVNASASDGSVHDATPAETAAAGERPVGEVSGNEPIREEAIVASEHEVRVRRTPRYGRFMVLGGAVFAVAAFIATYSLPQGQGYDRNTVFGFVLLGAVAIGVGLGAIAAIIASAATKHTERTVVADRIDVRTTAAPDEEDLHDLGELPAEAEPDERSADVEEHPVSRERRDDGA
ncbi:hypothetical protein [Humibacter ginsengisoli]